MGKPTEADEDDLTEVDLEALRRARALAKGVPQVERHKSWYDAAHAAAYHLQLKDLRLKPWQDPPMFGDIERAQPGAAQLLRRLLAVGLSRYEPEPLGKMEALDRVT